MKVIFLSIVMSVFVVAQNTEEVLKQKHEQAAHFFGDRPFLSGIHSFRQQKLRDGSNKIYSVYKAANAFCEFWTEDEWELYHSVMVSVAGDDIEVLNIYKLTRNFKTQTLHYTLFFKKQKSSVNTKVVVDREASTFEDQYFDMILQCTTKQSVALVPEIMKCTEQDNIVDCVLDAAFGQSADEVVSCILANDNNLQNRGVYWRIFLKPQGMGFVSAKPFGAKDECSTTTGCTHFVIPSGYKITIKATAAPGYKFEYWQYKGNLLSLDVEYSFIPSAGGDLVAHFVKE